MALMDRDKHVPEGMAFLQIIWEMEDKDEKESDERLPDLGERAPACLREIGTMLSLLDRLASCWWTCNGGSHEVEYLCGRIASNSRAALRLMRFGFYDESLSLCRSVGEIANLLFLFHFDEAAFQQWKDSSRRQRIRKFGPRGVRLRFEEKADVAPPINEERYRLLSEQSVHVHPGTKPQSYNLPGIPIAGAIYQEGGFVICLNELALALSVSLVGGALLLDIDGSIKKHITDAARTSIKQIGSLTLQAWVGKRMFAEE